MASCDVEDLLCLKKFRNLQSVNLCSTYHPLAFNVQLSDDSNNQQLSIAGSREMELLIFSLKNNLRILHLGAYLYDELLVYIAEMCKQLEKLEVNSEQVTDRGLTPVFVKLTSLKFIDVSACPNFTGLAVMDAGEHYGAKDLKRFVMALQGYEKQKVQERLAQVAPGCEVELRLKKSYKIASATD